MILFVDNNSGFMFIKTIIDIIVDVISSTYKNLKQVLPTRKNQIFGIMMENGDVYCRLDMDKYHITDVHVKNITYQNTLRHIYNCIKCGHRITKTDMEIRFQKRHKIGKRRFN